MIYQLALPSRATSFAGEVRPVMMARTIPTRLIAARITAQTLVTQELRNAAINRPVGRIMSGGQRWR